jgi:2-polyprenyl-6-methoxyphenol hydroxylase-like FAD-dependent oxidoreductase
LAAALELRRSAHAEVAIYERSSGQMQARGAGVVMQPDVEWLLRAHDTDPASLSVALSERIYLRQDGRAGRQGIPQRMTAWDVLYRALRVPLADVCYRQDSRLMSIEKSDAGVRVAFADGHQSDGDFVVGADGVHSACRDILAGTIPVTYAGYVAWRGLEDEATFPEDLVTALSDRFTLFVGDGMQLLCYLVPGSDGGVEAGRRRINWVWYVNTPAPELGRLLRGRSGHDYGAFLPPGELTAEITAQLRELAETALPPLLAQVIEASEVFMQPVLDVAPSRMLFGPAALIGDAAGTVRPHTASGTSKAFADAILLAMALDDWKSPDALPARLNQWERQRLGDLTVLSETGMRLAADSLLGVDDAPTPWPTSS